MTKPANPNKAPNPNPPDPKVPNQPYPKHKPPRDTRDDPAPNPNGDVQNTSPREEVEKVHRNRKR